MRCGATIGLLFIAVIGQQTVFGQSPIFSQYYATGLYLNPALAGLEKDIFLGMNYRSQWSNLGVPFNTFQFSAIKPIVKPGVRPKHLGGLGASFLNDVAGPNREFVNQSITLAGAYNFHLSSHGNSVLAVAVQGGLLQQRVNYDALQWSTQYSPITGFDGSLAGESGLLNTQVLTPVLNIGLMWLYTTKGLLTTSNTTLYNGFAVSNIIKPSSYAENQASSETLLLKVHGGLSRIWNRKYEISPNYLAQYQQRTFQLNVGAYFGYYIHPPQFHNSKSTKVTVGVWYRVQDAFILSTGFSNKSWNFAFSYDTNVSSLSRNLGFGSAYEISLAYKIPVNKGFKRFSSPLI